MDEKTGIQALQRFEQRAPQSQGAVKRREFESIRHGTTTLLAASNLADGKIIHHQLQPTRTEEDFCQFVEQTCQPLLADPAAEVVLLAHQLNTPLSESLVVWVAKQMGFQEELGKKGQRRVLQNQLTRMAFLEDESHRIRFVFTPKHCSWLNPLKTTWPNCKDT